MGYWAKMEIREDASRWTTEYSKQFLALLSAQLLEALRLTQLSPLFHLETTE